MEKPNKKVREGIIVSDKMDKTVVVSVERKTMHPFYKKVIKLTTKLKAHDPENKCKVGDRVRIVETKPLSKDKRWKIVEILGRDKGKPEEEDKGMPAPVRREKEEASEAENVQAEKVQP